MKQNIIELTVGLEGVTNNKEHSEGDSCSGLNSMLIQTGVNPLK